jgi:hypothetical protein
MTRTLACYSPLLGGLVALLLLQASGCLPVG